MRTLLLVLTMIVAWHALEAELLRRGWIDVGPHIGSVRGAVLGILTVIAAHLRFRRAWRAKLGLRLPAGGFWLVPGACVLLVATLAHPPSEWTTLPPAVAIPRVFLATFEELAFRGLVFALLLRYGRSTAVWGSAAMFSAAHFANLFYGVEWERMPLVLAVTFGMGAALARVRESSRSVIPCIVLHGYWNLSAASAARIELDHYYGWAALLVGVALISGVPYFDNR